MEIMAKDGMTLFPVYSAEGIRAPEFECIEIIERHEKRTGDHSDSRWFPQILVKQRCMLQRRRGLDPLNMAVYGEPFEGWILLEDESTVLPFVGGVK
jgi:hypothetical protein